MTNQPLCHGDGRIIPRANSKNDLKNRIILPAKTVKSLVGMSLYPMERFDNRDGWLVQITWESA